MKSFMCNKCGECCRNFSDEFGVLLLKEDIDRIAFSIGKDASEFIKLYCNNIFINIDNESVQLLTLKHLEGECTFLKNNACSIHAIKPYQCQNGPFGFFWESATIYQCMQGVNTAEWSTNRSDANYIELLLEE